MSEPPPSPSPDLAPVLAAKDAETIVRLLQPHLRGLIKQATPASLEVFDSVFIDAVLGAASRRTSTHGLDSTTTLSGGVQEMGFGSELAITTVLSFLINICATITTERTRVMNPGMWQRLTGSTVVTVPAADRFTLELANSGLSSDDKAALNHALEHDPALLELLRNLRVAAK